MWKSNLHIHYCDNLLDRQKHLVLNKKYSIIKLKYIAQEKNDSTYKHTKMLYINMIYKYDFVFLVILN